MKAQGDQAERGMTNEAGKTRQEREASASADVCQSMRTVLESAGIEYRGGYVCAGSQRIHYLEYGSGPPVVLVHGGGPGSLVWYRQIAELGKSFRVIAPDNPIAGLSARTVLARPMYEFARDYLSNFLDALGLSRVPVAGLSLGGLAALSVAIDSPGRIGRLALIGSAGLGREISIIFRLLTLPGMGWLGWRSSQMLAARLVRSLGNARAGHADVLALARYAYHVASFPGQQAAKLAALRSFANLRGQRKVFSAQELALVEAPTLIVWGDKDRVIPVTHAERAEAAIPDSRLHVLEDTGHAPQIQQAERVSGLLGEFFAA